MIKPRHHSSLLWHKNGSAFHVNYQIYNPSRQKWFAFYLSCPSKVAPYDSSCESRLFGLLSHFCWIFGRLDLLYIPHQHYNHHNFHDSKSAHQSTKRPSSLIKHLLDDRVSLGNGIFILFPTQTYKFPLRRAKKTQTKHFRIIGGFLWRTAEPATAQRGQKPSGK